VETDVTADAVPSLFEWMGGDALLSALFAEFYRRVALDPVIGPVFAAMDERHAEKVAAFVGQVFGGPAGYTDAGGSHAAMIARHMGRMLTAGQRARWVGLLIETADHVGLPEDPEFRAAFVGYIEWGSRLAVINSAQGVPTPEAGLPMPNWNWGPPGGPWRGR
jgi:hemoglobin